MATRQARQSPMELQRLIALQEMELKELKLKSGTRTTRSSEANLSKLKATGLIEIIRSLQSAYRTAKRQMQEGQAEEAVEEAQEGEEKPRQGLQTPYSGMSWAQAQCLAWQLSLHVVDGEQLMPLPPPPAGMRIAEFGYSDFPDEDAGCARLCEHHRQALAAGGMENAVVSDLHAKRVLFTLQTDVGSFRGGVDSIIHGPEANGVDCPAHLQEHKQLAADKRAYRMSHGQEIGNPRENDGRGEAILQLLACQQQTGRPVQNLLTNGRNCALARVARWRGEKLILLHQQISPAQGYAVIVRALQANPAMLLAEPLAAQTVQGMERSSYPLVMWL